MMGTPTLAHHIAAIARVQPTLAVRNTTKHGHYNGPHAERVNAAVCVAARDAVPLELLGVRHHLENIRAIVLCVRFRGMRVGDHCSVLLARLGFRG